MKKVDAVNYFQQSEQAEIDLAKIEEKIVSIMVKNNIDFYKFQDGFIINSNINDEVFDEILPIQSHNTRANS